MFDIKLVFDHLHVFLQGIGMTLFLTAVPLFFGFFLAVASSLIIVEKVPVLSNITRFYSLLFRGSPMLVQTYLVYYGLAQFEAVRDSWAWNFLKDEYFCVIMVFSLNTGAYTTEILRNGILGTPPGEIESAKTLGLSKLAIYRKIIFPSTFRRVLPLYNNEVIYLMQSSSIASIFTLMDITGAARWLNASFNVAYEGMLTAALVYLVLTYGLIGIFKIIERKFCGYLMVR
ncbi:MAG: ABC transporter permease subunit [Hydrotalea sp.]|nr:ABC transporter permease subunit [Hydrotalea sp.]